MLGVCLYWLVVLVLTPVVGGVLAMGGQGERPTFPEVLGTGLLFLPAVQVLASVVAAVLTAFFPVEDRKASWRAIGWITGWSLLGSLGGALSAWVFLQ
jgi:hypothetical protein